MDEVCGESDCWWIMSICPPRTETGCLLYASFPLTVIDL